MGAVTSCCYKNPLCYLTCCCPPRGGALDPRAREDASYYSLGELRASKYASCEVQAWKWDYETGTPSPKHIGFIDLDIQTEEKVDQMTIHRVERVTLQSGSLIWCKYCILCWVCRRKAEWS